MPAQSKANRKGKRYAQHPYKIIQGKSYRVSPPSLLAVLIFVWQFMQRTVGNYTLLQPLGEGGMGAVYLAQHHHLQYYAVVKSLHPAYAQNGVLRQRFYTEAQVMAQVSHPAIVRLYDFVIQDGVPYLIMEYVHGTPLDKVIASRGALPPEECYQILAPIWDALHYLHSLKIIHRDIKPSNIMVLPEGGAKLIDFGIAKTLDSDYKLTQTGMQVGTVLYMAPEQIQGVSVSPATDLYAMGLVVYESLFGHFPWDWQGKTQFQLYQMLLTQPPAIPGWAPDAWISFFEKALAKNPADRYASAHEMQAAFEALILGDDDDAQASEEPASEQDMRLAPFPTASAHTAKAISPTAPTPPPLSPPYNPEIAVPAPAPRKSPTALAIIPLLLILIVAVSGGLVAFFKYKAHKRRQELQNQIYTLISSYNAANEASLKKEIIHQLKKKFPNAIISEISFLEPTLPRISSKNLDRFDEGYDLTVDGEIMAYVQFSYEQVQVAVEVRECSYETGFWFWRETHYGHQRWGYQLITPYKCEVRIMIPCIWRVQKEGRVERTIEDMQYYETPNCTAQASYRGREWPISDCE